MKTHTVRALMPMAGGTGGRLAYGGWRAPAARLAARTGALALVLSACHTGSIPADTERVAPGVYHHRVELIEGPWVIHVLEVDLPQAWRAGIRIRSARGQEPGTGLERTSALAADAVAAVNGDFYYQDKPARTAGLQIREGTLLARPRRRSAFAITPDGRPMVAVFGFEAGLITADRRVLPILQLNREPPADGITYYNHFAQGVHDTVHAAVGFELQTLGKQSVVNDTVAARVTQVRRQAWPLKLMPGQWLVAAGGDNPDVASIVPGDTVRLFCRLPPSSGPLAEAIGGGPRIIRDGAVSIEHEQEGLSPDFATARHPRTAVGYSRTGKVLFLVTVDGRQPGYSVGMTLQELADLMANRLARFSQSRRNAYQAINLDGGGSTTMVVRHQVVNRPSDQTGERPVANALLVVGPETRTAALFP
ncbi:MAG: phosphodiester glycosidase family protein [Gemmatimonadota bacterium]